MPILGGGAAIAAGTIQTWPSATIPAGWLKCNGAAVSRTLYAALFNEIGTTYGAGDGTTFNVPDMRGEFMRGLDDGRGVDSGRGIGTSQSDEIKAHGHGTHKYSGAGTGVTQYSNYLKYVDSTVPNDIVGGIETRPRNRAMHFIIKF